MYGKSSRQSRTQQKQKVFVEEKVFSLKLITFYSFFPGEIGQIHTVLLSVGGELRFWGAERLNVRFLCEFKTATEVYHSKQLKSFTIIVFIASDKPPTNLTPHIGEISPSMEKTKG